MEIPFICTQEDDFTFEKPRWIAHLSNGNKVLQDDERPGVEPQQSWLRLKDYCRQTGDYLVSLTLQFRSHHEQPLPANAEGYFFCNKILHILSGPTVGFYLVGHIDNGKIYVQHWRVPELLYFGSDVRDINCESEYYLIRKHNE